MKKIYKKAVMMACCALMPFFGYAQLGEDVTSLLTDPGMDALTSWTNNGFKTSNKGNNYSPMFGGNFIEQWTASTAESMANLADISIEQSLTDLPNGAYLFSAACIACQQGDDTQPIEGVYLYANDAKTSIATGNGTPERFYTLATVADGALTVGFKTESTTANWIAWDNAQLHYYADADVDVPQAIAMLSLQESIAAGKAYSDIIKMQVSVFATLSDAIAAAESIITNGGTADAAIAAKEALEEAMDAADASITAYENLLAQIGTSTEVFDKYASSDDAEFVIDELEQLQGALDTANTMYNEANSDTAAVNSQITNLENASAAVIVKEEIYLCLDSLNTITTTCEVGTQYGCFTQAWMDKISALQAEMDNYLTMYEEGNLTPSELLPHIEEAYAIITNFWTSMITIDFSMPLNDRMFPYSADIAEEANEHEFAFRGDAGLWRFGKYVVADNTIEEWDLSNATCDNAATNADGNLAWYQTDAWMFVRVDGVFHPATASPIAAIFTAPEDAIYIINSSVSSQDADRVNKNRGDLRCYAYFVQNGATTANQIGDYVSYNYNTDPAQQMFYINMKAGDKVALAVGDTRHNSNGNALSKIDTLYALGQKDAETFYTKADAEASGLLFFNPYTPAEDWSTLPAAIEKGKTTLTDNKEKVGEGFAMLDSTAYAALDSIVGVAEKMLAVQLASQPEVDQMIITIDNYIEALYASAGYAICLASDVLPNDTLVDFTDWQMLPDGLYYIQDATNGKYVTAPNSDADKQSVYISELIDETMTQQNAQVWHFAYADTCGAYAIGTYKNDGNLWTIEQETECGMSQSLGFYHIAENIQARTGSVHFVLDPASVLWRTFRIYFNGTRYCLTGGTGDFAKGWINVMMPGGATAGRANGGAFNFGWNLIPFAPEEDKPGEGIDNATATVVSVSYYNLMGVQVAQPEAGVTIKRTVRADGTVEAVKVWAK